LSTQPISMPAQRVPGLDFLLVIVAAILLVMLQIEGATHAQVLSVPVVYLFLSKLMAGSDLPTAAGRAYLLCFLAGLLGLSLRGSELLHSLSEQMESRSLSAEAIPALLQSTAGLLPHLVGPLMLGVTLYAACSVYEGLPIESHSQAKPLLEKLNEWFQASGTPEELRQYVIDLHQHMQDLGGSCGNVAQQFAETDTELTQLVSATTKANTQLSQMTSSASGLSSELKQLQNDVVGVNASIDQLQAAVSQIGSVVDDFSEIISKKILDL